MGAVYCATDAVTGARVAIMVLHGTTPAERARLENEAEALADLRHPAIVRYLAHG